MKPNPKNLLWLYLLVPILPLLYLLVDQSGLYLFRDISLVYLPSKQFWADSVLQFHTIPGWNPYIYGGIPFIGDMNLGPLHPLNFLFLLFPVYSAFILFLLVHVLVFSFSSYWMFREYKFGRTGALLAALSISLSSFYFSTFSLLHLLSSMAAIPFFLVFLKRILKEPTLRAMAALAIVMAWPIYAGDPQISYGMAIVLVGFSILKISEQKFKAVFFLFCSSLLAGLLSLAQILPALDIVADSERGFGKIPLATAQLYSFHPIRLLEFVLALPFGNLSGDYWGGRFLPQPTVSPFFFHVYLGAFLGLAFLWLFSRFLLKRRKKNRKSLTVLLFLLMVSFGSHMLISLYQLLFLFFPGWNLFRYPERWLIAFVFLLFLLMAPAFRWISIKYLAGTAAKKVKHQKNEKFLFPALLVMAAVCYFFPLPNGAVELRTFASSFAHLFLVLGLFALLYFFRGKIKSVYVLRALLCLIFVVDLFPVSFSLLWRVPKDQLSMEKNNMAEKIQAYKAAHESDFQTGAARRFFHGTYAGHFPSRMPNPIFAGIAGDWAILYPNLSMYYQIESASGYDSFEPQNILQLWYTRGKTDAKRLLDLFSVSFLAARSADGTPEVRLNSASAPMIFTPQRLWTFIDREAAEEKIFSPDFNVSDEAILMGTTYELQNQTAWQIISYNRSPDYMRAELRDWNGSAEEITLIWNERFHKNWKAYFNGNKIPVQEANLWAMAVKSKVPAKQGVQLLEFRYEDEAFNIGIKISIASLIFLLLLLLAPMRLFKRG